MNKRMLGKTGIELSELGYGCSGLWAKDVLGKSAIHDDQAYQLIKTSTESGITFFDTGINYGYSEQRLGMCLERLFRETNWKRSDVIIETKFGEKMDEKGNFKGVDWSADWIKKSLEISLKRLKLDYVDLFAAHGGRITDFSETMIHCLMDLKRQGVIRAFGVNSFQTEVIEWIGKEKNFEYVMLDYNILKQEREPLISKLKESGIGVISGAALGQSLYSNRVFKVHNRNDLWYLLRALKNFRINIKNGKRFRFINQNSHISGNQAALRYVLDNNDISSAVFNTTNLEHLGENIKASYFEIPQELYEKIRKERRSLR